MKLRPVAPVVMAAGVAGWAYERSARRREARLARTGRLVDVGTHRVRLCEEGQGRPTVVLVHGAGDCAASWTYVQHQVSRFAHVVSYDRAGIGGSEPGPPPTLDRFVDELQRVLQAGAIPGPYLLVGHSLGGLPVSRYARRHRDEVRGLVLVDATPEAIANDPGVKTGFAISGAMARALQAAAPVGVTRLLLVSGKMPLYPEQPQFRAVVSAEEYAHWVADVCRTFASSAAGDELRAVLAAAEAAKHLGEGVQEPRFGSLPLGILTSHAFGDKWIEWHRELATRSSHSFHRITDTSSHNIHLRHPEMVVQAVRDVVSMAHA